MRILFIALKVSLNFVFFIFYVLLSIIIASFLYGLLLFVFGQSIPWSDDMSHYIVAWGAIVIVSLLTIMKRKYCYLPIHNEVEKLRSNKKTQNVTEWKKEIKIEHRSENQNWKEDEELQIYINKEIK